MTKKHLSFDERATIQIALKECKSFREIAVEVNKSPSTISREVRNHFVIERKGAYGHPFNECKHRKECWEKAICMDKPNCITKNCRFCKECNHSCSKFEKEVCSKLSYPPYVCNASIS